MAKRKIFLATDPAGREHKRVSATRFYSHTIVYKNEADERWANAGWCGRPDLAYKVAATLKTLRYSPAGWVPKRPDLVHVLDATEKA